MKAASAAGDVRPLDLGDGRHARLRIVVNRRARRVSLRVDPASQEVIATAPSLRARARAEAFARERALWIAAALDRLPRPTPFVDGGVIPVRGAPHRLVHASGRAAPRFDGDAIVSGGLDASDFARRVRRFLVGQARTDLAARVEAHCAALGTRASRITIKDTRSRWGSCTRDGALAFSWRVILAPPDVLDYLAAHEVAHLREMNHGPRFWALVESLMPDYARPRAWLKRHGSALHAIGAEAAAGARAP